jgi:hypothetical protein
LALAFVGLARPIGVGVDAIRVHALEYGCPHKGPRAQSKADERRT